MQALLTLQAVPGRVANPILENLLGDETDDVRLLAFGMLDSAEKKISVQIQHERELLDTESTTEQRFDCLRHLAELHWELIYASLAQGELRRHILSQARTYLASALALGVAPSPGLLFLQGRILLAQGEIEPAQAAIEQALALGLSRISALPYLAEIAYRRRQFSVVQDCMRQLTQFNIAPRPRAIADLWTGRDKMSNLSDFNHLPHL
jgi:tetratricopeptide (TPR) repeat protein